MGLNALQQKTTTIKMQLKEKLPPVDARRTTVTHPHLQNLFIPNVGGNECFHGKDS